MLADLLQNLEIDERLEMEHTNAQQQQILEKVLYYSEEYLMDCQPVVSVVQEEDSGDWFIGVFWKLGSGILADLEIYPDEEEVVYLIKRSGEAGSHIAAYETVEDSEVLFKKEFL